ncbi:hypothetical protein ACFYOA_04655 [Streptomyces iakyrus]|uniref:hypothetical protein n=1 Tax=Streptomyces iakyrus TaxID=68219 RepID=UPI0036AF20E5
MNELTGPQHTEQHIATMAQLHRANRYDRATSDVERITGKRPLTVEGDVRFGSGGDDAAAAERRHG